MQSGHWLYIGRAILVLLAGMAPFLGRALRISSVGSAMGVHTSKHTRSITSGMPSTDSVANRSHGDCEVNIGHSKTGTGHNDVADYFKLLNVKTNNGAVGWKKMLSWDVHLPSES